MFGLELRGISMQVRSVGAWLALLCYCYCCCTFFTMTQASHTPPPSTPPQLCRSKGQLLQPSFFELHSCSWCFHYLARSPHIRALPRQPFLLVLSNVTSLQAGTVVMPNVSREDDVRRLCSLVSPGTCQRWKECCRAARECCRRQVQAALPLNHTCPRTWDGWGCWEDVAAGTEEYVPCPSFLQYAVLSEGWGAGAV